MDIYEMNESSSIIIQIVPRDINAGPINVAKDLIMGLTSAGLKSEIYCLRNRDGKRLFCNFIRLIKIVKNKKNFILHSHGVVPDLVCFILSFIFKFKWISTVHADPKEDLKFIYPKTYGFICFVWNSLLKKADTVVYLTEYIYSKQNLKNKKFIHNSRLIVEKSLVKIANFSTQRKIGFCGVLIERKNIRALVTSTLSNSGYFLTIAGDGPLKTELQSITNLSEQINFLGHQDDLTYFWNEIDILVLPSFAEGVPLAAIEAIARGIPLILMNLNNYKNIFTESESVFISTLSNTSLNQSVETIYNNYDSYHNNAIKAYNERFDFNNWISQYKEVYFD